jgi:hypothetical protein
VKRVNLKITDEAIETLKLGLGKLFLNYSSDQPDMMNRVNFVKIYIDQKCLDLKNEHEVIDIDGPEDFAVFRISECEKSVHEYESSESVEVDVNKLITDIKIIRDIIVCKEHNQEIYCVEIDVGLIFEFGEKKILFEKDVWFSENIILHDLHEKSPEILPVGDGWNFEYPLSSELSRSFFSIQHNL